MASSNIYNHRSLQPSGAPAPQLARLNESFDAIRAEFDALATDAGLARGQRDEFEAKVLTQVNELNIIRQALYDLEAQHSKVRQQFEDEVARLRGELHAMRQAGASVSGGGGSGGPGAGAPPGIPGLAPGSGAGQGGAGGSVIGGPGNHGPGYSEYFREGRDRERERERDRDVRDRTMDVRERDPRDVRDRERDVRDLRALGLDRERDVRERERDLRDRDRERDRERDRDRDRDREREVRDRDRDRLVDPRDPKRMKNERGGPKPDHFSPNPTPRLPPPPGPGLPPYESSVGAGPGAQGPVGPGQVGSGPVSGSGSSVGGLVGQTSGPSQMGQLSSQLGGGSGQIVPLGSQGQGGGGGFPDDLDVHTVPPELKKEGSDWFALFNPKAKRVLDVNLVHTLTHESVVCCVRFSADGKFLATGCNRTAQIYDTKTGNKTCVLFDESAGKQGDLYIRSVCFSPDGKFLATGAEDKQIRIWDIAKKKIRNIFDGHQQEIYSLDFSHDGRLIVSGSGDKTARIWDMVDGTSKVLTINDPDSLNNDAGVTSVAISPNGQFVAAGSLDTVVRLWDVSTGHLVERLRGHRDSVYSVAFTPDGKGLISGSLDKTLKYWDVAALYSSGPGSVKGRKEGGPVNGPGGTVVRKDGDKSSQCTMNFTGHKDYVLSVAVSHDGQWVVSGSKDRGVQFWDARTATVQCMLQGHKNSVISIDLSPAGSILATGSGDWQARIWNYSPVA